MSKEVRATGRIPELPTLIRYFLGPAHDREPITKWKPGSMAQGKTLGNGGLEMRKKFSRSSRSGGTEYSMRRASSKKN